MTRCVAAVVLAAVVACTPARTSEPGTFRPADADPYFRSGPAARAIARLRLRDFAGAAQLLSDAPEARSGELTSAARFLLAYAELHAGRAASAAPRFDALVDAYPVLAEHARRYAAEAWLEAGRPADALARAEAVPADVAVAVDAALLRARALSGLGRHADAAAAYSSWLTRNPDDTRAVEARFRLGESLAAAGRGDDARRAWREVYVAAPHQEWGRRAAEALGGAPELSGEERGRRAQALADAMRHAEAEREWQAALAAAPPGSPLGCTASFQAAQSVFLQRDRPRAARLFDAAAEACQRAGDASTRARALYQSGRSWTVREEEDPPATRTGIASYERLAREHPEHTLADDARLRQAEAHLALGETARFEELLAGLPAAFPGGDMRGEAYWRLAFRAWRSGDLRAARSWLEQELAALPREEGFEQAGRTLYWLGRLHAREGRPREAAEAWERAVREYPLSYGALVSLNRLREADRPRADRLQASLRREDRTRTELAFRARPLLETPCFRRAVELTRLGLPALVRRELAACGVAPPRRGETPGEDRAEDLRLFAVLLDRAGDPALSHVVFRHVLGDVHRAWPSPANRALWELSFPAGFADVVEPAARAAGLDPALLYAIVREESAFDPLVESAANALGLTQLTLETGQRYAGGLRVTAATLLDPEVNAPVGARALAHNWATFGNRHELAIAAYNAGPGTVSRWRRDPELVGLAADEWVEALPYGETRGYVKRVLASLFTYGWLYGPPSRDPVPTLPLPLR